MPAMSLNSSAARWLLVPAPPDAKESFPGLARASAMSSCTVFTGTSLLTTRTLGVKQSCEIGAKSRIGSNGTFG